MCQSNDCNDYSLLTANTGIRNISAADTSLTGVGASTVLTAGGANGTIIKSIIVKAIQATTQGMVRIFIDDGTNRVLYKEVPIPIQPQAPVVPVPTPKYTMFEIALEGGLKLQSGYDLMASTQNSESFNVIAEGLDWAYPAPEDMPNTCCNFEQEAADTGIGIISVANTNLDGSGLGIVPIFTADGAANGATIKAITIKALQSTHPDTVRLFISKDGGTNWFLMQEVSVPQTTQSAYEPSFKQVLNMNYSLQPTYIIGAATDIGQNFAITIEGTNWTYPI